MNFYISLLIGSLRNALRARQDVELENLALRHQLAVLMRSARRPRLEPADRLLWCWLSRRWSGWRSAVVVIKPDTIVRWHRRAWRRYWSWRSRPSLGSAAHLSVPIDPEAPENALVLFQLILLQPPWKDGLDAVLDGLTILLPGSFSRDGRTITTSDHASDAFVRDLSSIRREYRKQAGRAHIRTPYAQGGSRRRPHRTVRLEETLRELVDDPSLIDRTRPPSRSTLDAWSSSFHWQDRLLDLERDAAEQERRGQLKALRDMNERHAKEGVALQQKAIERLKRFPAEDLSAADAVRALVEGVRLERLARGAPTDHVRQEGEELYGHIDLRNFNNEELRRLVELAERGAAGAGEEEPG